MPQNTIPFTLSSEQITAVDAALETLETQLADLIVLQAANKRRMMQLGQKSEAFCRQSLRVLTENPQVVPPTLNVAEAVRDLNTRDQLKARAIRLSQLLSRMDDTAFALGGDAMRVATRGYSLLKVVGRSEGLDGFRRELGGRFARSRPTDKTAPPAA